MFLEANKRRESQIMMEKMIGKRNDYTKRQRQSLSIPRKSNVSRVLRKRKVM